MKMMPWFCCLAVVGAPLVHADNAIESYRAGHYIKSAGDLMKDSKRSAVEYDYLGQMYLYGYGVLKNNDRGIQNLKEAASRGFLPAQQVLAKYELISNRDPKEALKWFKKAADQGDLKAQLYCAAAYHFGVGVSKNEDKARKYDILAAKAGNSLAQASLAEHFLDSRHGSNHKLGMIWLNRAIEAKEPEALFLLGEVNMKGKLVPQDLDKAKSLFDSALAAGYLPAMQGLAELAKVSKDEALAKTWEEKFKAANSKIEQKPEVLAAHWLTRGKAKNFVDAGYGVGGIFTAWSSRTALRQNEYNQPPQMAGISRKALYKPRFEMADPARIPLTDYYDILVKSSLASEKTPTGDVAFTYPAYPLLEKKHTVLLDERAALGDPTAQFALAQLYQQGKGGVDKNLEIAKGYYLQAIAQQDLKAEYTLGIMYLTGEATGTPDYKEALSFLNDAAFKGNPESQYILGHLYEVGQKGEGDTWAIEPNPERARAMYALAAFNQSREGEYHLAEMLVRDKTGSLSVQEKQKRHALMKRLYRDAAAKGIKEAVLPLAFFDAMDSSKEKQANALRVAKEEAKQGSLEAALLYGMLLDRGIGTDADPSEAVFWYKKADKNPVSAFILGTYYATGHVVSEDQDRSAELLKEAANAGFAFADLNLAILNHDRGLTYMPDLEKAHERGNSKASLLLADNALSEVKDPDAITKARGIYQALAERGDREAELKLGYLLERGLGGKTDYEAAAHWYERSANQGQPIAQYLLGRLNQMGYLGKYPNYTVSKAWYTRAMKNYAPAAVALGFLHETVERNYDAASKAYQVAAEKEHVIGKFDLGLIYEYGKSRPVDYKKAESLYLEAAEKGHVRAMVQLAGLYLNGNITKFRADSTARDWYEKAAQHGDRDALYYLGYMAEKGLGMSKDLALAAEHYQRASDKGDMKATLALARLYQAGEGVTKDPEKAAELYKQLSSRGNGYAQYQLAMLAYQGALKDINQDKAKQWLKRAGANGCAKAQHALQWINAKGSESTSFIEPLSLGTASALNEGSEGDSQVQ